MEGDAVCMCYGAVLMPCPSALSAQSSRLQVAWDVRNNCKHNGAVLPLSSAPEGRGADGVDAMALWVT
jgi:hypothetical protein